MLVPLLILLLWLWVWFPLDHGLVSHREHGETREPGETGLSNDTTKDGTCWLVPVGDEPVVGRGRIAGCGLLLDCSDRSDRAMGV